MHLEWVGRSLANVALHHNYQLSCYLCILDRCSENSAHILSKSDISICWRHLVTSKESSNPIFLRKRPILLYTYAKCSELPSNISTIPAVVLSICLNFRLIHFGDRVYDPVLGQWMTPDWEQVGGRLSSPLQLLLYRYRNNNPINKIDNDIVRFKGKLTLYLFLDLSFSVSAYMSVGYLYLYQYIYVSLSVLYHTLLFFFCFLNIQLFSFMSSALPIFDWIQWYKSIPTMYLYVFTICFVMFAVQYTTLFNEL